MRWFTIWTVLFVFAGCSAFAQEVASDSQESFWGRIFLPSIDVGYQVPNSDLIGGSVRFGTSVEYRLRNNNDFFVRVSYDTYGAQYNLSRSNNTTNNIEGKVQFTDVLIAPGYRFGDKKYRMLFSVMPGIKLYEFPVASLNGQQILVSQKGRSIFTTSFLTVLEYYFDEKSALTLSLFQNQVWRKTDFWEDGGSAFGFSVGFITSLL